MLTPSRQKIYQVSIRPSCLLEQDFKITPEVKHSSAEYSNKFFVCKSFDKLLSHLWTTVLMGQLLLQHIVVLSRPHLQDPDMLRQVTLICPLTGVTEAIMECRLIRLFHS